MRLTEEDKSFIKECIKEVLGEMETWGVDETCRFLRISKSALYHMTSEKRIPHMKGGKGLVFDKAEIREWAEKNGGKNVGNERI